MTQIILYETSERLHLAIKKPYRSFRGRTTVIACIGNDGFVEKLLLGITGRDGKHRFLCEAVKNDAEMLARAAVFVNTYMPSISSEGLRIALLIAGDTGFQNDPDVENAKKYLYDSCDASWAKSQVKDFETKKVTHAIRVVKNALDRLSVTKDSFPDSSLFHTSSRPKHGKCGLPVSQLV